MFGKRQQKQEGKKVRKRGRKITLINTHCELAAACTVLSALQTFPERGPSELGIVSFSVLQTRKQVREGNELP